MSFTGAQRSARPTFAGRLHRPAAQPSQVAMSATHIGCRDRR